MIHLPRGGYGKLVQKELEAQRQLVDYGAGSLESFPPVVQQPSYGRQGGTGGNCRHVEIIIESGRERMTARPVNLPGEVQTMIPIGNPIPTPDWKRIHASVKVAILMMKRMIIANNVLKLICILGFLGDKALVCFLFYPTSIGEV